MSLLDTISEWGSAFKDTANSALSLYSQYNDTTINLENQQAATQMAKLQLDMQRQGMQSQAQLQQLQAQAILNQAQRQANGGWFDQAGFNTSLGNMQGMLARGSAGNDMMLWLTVAGVAIAFMQFVKR